MVTPAINTVLGSGTCLMLLVLLVISVRKRKMATNFQCNSRGVRVRGSGESTSKGQRANSIETAQDCEFTPRASRTRWFHQDCQRPDKNKKSGIGRQRID